MELSVLVQEFKDRTEIMDNKKVVGMIVYGSRVNHYESVKSDLDIAIITDGENSYKGVQVINGVRVEMNIFSLNDIFWLIDEDRKNNNRFFASVFNTGKTVKNEGGIVDILRKSINSRYIGGMEKRSICEEKKDELNYLYYSFINAEGHTGEENYFYYNLLEKIRSNYNYVNNCSRLVFTKVYDVFMNNNFMSNYYQLKMPDKAFMGKYLEALGTQDYNKRKELVEELLAMIEFIPDKVSYANGKRSFYGISALSDLKYRTVYLQEKIKKGEEMLISNHAIKDSVYYILLYRLKDLIYHLRMDEDEEIQEQTREALDALSVDDRIKCLESLFSFIDRKFNIDYDNYLIKKY